jgi:transposase
MTMAKRKDAKSEALREHGSFNPRLQKVHDELFQQSEFFDPRDLVQVKYEMLRRVRVDDISVTRASAAFGVSRPTYYQAQAALDRGGIPALVSKRPGPRQAHKLSDAVLQFIDEQRLRDKTLRAVALAQMVQERFGMSLHPRSIERALSRRQKRGR